MKGYASMGLIVTGLLLYTTGAWANPEPEPPDAGSHQVTVAVFTVVKGPTPHDATLVWCKNLNDQDNRGTGWSDSMRIERDGALIKPIWVDCDTVPGLDCNRYCKPVNQYSPLGVWVDKGLSPGFHEYDFEPWVDELQVCGILPDAPECTPKDNLILYIKIGDHDAAEPERDAGLADNHQAEEIQGWASEITYGTDRSNAHDTTDIGGTDHETGSGGCNTTDRGASVFGLLLLFFLVLILGRKGLQAKK